MNTSRVIALSSMVAFATQVAFALLMLRWFTPTEVGEFSVISQIAFFWMTLALAQSNLSLLANQHLHPHIAARLAWRSSALRGAALLPVAAIAVWISQLNLWPSLLWVALLAAFQMGWMLAQSFTLRAGTALQQSGVRVVPPLIATLVASLAEWLDTSAGWGGPTLVMSAWLGYALGASWLVPAWRAGVGGQSQSTDPHLTDAQQGDTRSASLRVAHTLVDALLATAIVVVWQRLYGAEETGWMSALLRVLGFLPAVVHMAWAQVALAQGVNVSVQLRRFASPWWLGVSAFACVIFLGASCGVALQMEWLDPKWLGAWGYIAPLVLWQGSACLSAAFSHRPFQTQAAQTYSWACMGLAGLQALVLLTPFFREDQAVTAIEHMSVFGWVSGMGLLCLTLWMARLR